MFVIETRCLKTWDYYYYYYYYLDYTRLLFLFQFLFANLKRLFCLYVSLYLKFLLPNKHKRNIKRKLILLEYNLWSLLFLQKADWIAREKKIWFHQMKVETAKVFFFPFRFWSFKTESFVNRMKLCLHLYLDSCFITLFNYDRIIKKKRDHEITI